MANFNAEIAGDDPDAESCRQRSKRTQFDKTVPVIGLLLQPPAPGIKDVGTDLTPPAKISNAQSAFLGEQRSLHDSGCSSLR